MNKSQSYRTPVERCFLPSSQAFLQTVQIVMVTCASFFIAGLPAEETAAPTAEAGVVAATSDTLLTVTTADGREIQIDTSILPPASTAPTALGHTYDAAAVADAAFLHAWNEVYHGDIEENQFRDRQAHLRVEWAKDIERRAAARAKALAARDELLAARRQQIEQGLQYNAESEVAYQQVLANFKAEYEASSIVMTDEMVELLAAGKAD